jgi:hypothetical protein
MFFFVELEFTIQTLQRYGAVRRLEQTASLRGVFAVLVKKMKGGWL